MYADDVTVYVDYRAEDVAQETIERNLNIISDWAKIWYMNFNPTKTEQLHFTRSRNHIPIEIRMEEEIVEIVNSHKHLGVTLQTDGRWGEHISQTTRKAKKRLDIIRSFSRTMDRKSLEKLYISFVRPILEYGCTVWANCSKGEQESLESIQIDAIRIATGAKRGTSHQELQSEMGWPSLKERRKYQLLVQMYKIQHNLAPQGLTENMPSTTNVRNPYNIRSANNLDPPRARSEAYATSFFPNSCRLWNELPEEIKSLNSLEDFKSHVKPKNTPRPQHYYLGTRREQIIICRLRVNNADLRNLAETDLCDCNMEAETTEHYLMSCITYMQQRRDLTARLMNIQKPKTTELLLMGSEELTQDENRTIITATLMYINETARF